MNRLLVACSLLVFVACSRETVGPEPNDAEVDESLISSRSQGIVGGISDPRRTYVVGVGDNGGAFCSGTLISRRTVITAGHCYGNIRRVHTGLRLEGQKLEVKRSVRHPGYDRQTLANDLAIIELAADAPFQPAPLLRENMNDAVGDYVGPPLTFGGYGYEAGHTGFGTRRVVTFPIIAVGPANLQNGHTVQAIDATMFYYKLDGKNTCNGDSGGPAFIPRGGVERHAGVTSFGDAACTIDGVQQRTDAPAIAGFIQQWIDTFEGANNACRSNGVCDESCNQNGQLVDPDCAENHCARDGMCVLSCVHPVDPDCSGDVCRADGVCDPSCATPDPDCAGLPGTTGSTGSPGTTGATGSTGPTPAAAVMLAIDLPLDIPDNDSAGAQSRITLGQSFANYLVTVEYAITHGWRGDLEVTFVDAGGSARVLHARANPDDSGRDLSGSVQLDVADLPAGTYALVVRDLAQDDAGTITRFALDLRPRVP